MRRSHTSRNAAQQYRQSYGGPGGHGMPPNSCPDMMEGMCYDPMGYQCSTPSAQYPGYGMGPQQYVTSPRKALGPLLQQMGILPMSYMSSSGPSMMPHGSHSAHKPNPLGQLNDFLERSYELQDRAHKLWVMEQNELQRGVDLRIISTGVAADCSPHKTCASPTTARAVGVVPSASLLMTPPSASMLLNTCLHAVGSPMLSDQCLLSPTAVLGPHMDMQRPRAMTGLAAGIMSPPPSMPCSTSAPMAAHGVHASTKEASLNHMAPNSACGTMQYAPAPGGPGTVVGPAKRSGMEERRQRQAQLQQRLDGSVAMQGHGAAAGNMFFGDLVSPASPVHLLLSGSTGALDSAGLDAELLDMYGLDAHAHAELQLASDPHLSVGPINTSKKPRY